MVPPTKLTPNPPPRKCLAYNLRLLSLSGLIQDGKRVWISRVLIIYFLVFYFLLLINLFLVIQKVSTGESDGLGGAAVQQCFDLLVTLIVFVDFIFFVHRVYPILPDLQKLFDKIDPEIRHRCDTKERNIFWFTFVMSFAGASLTYAKKLIQGSPPAAIQFAAESGLKANPSKQLPLLAWFPVDDTVQPAYTIALGLNVVFLMICCSSGIHIFGYYQMISIHIKGYCDTISRPLHQLGSSHHSTKSQPKLKAAILKRTAKMTSSATLDIIKEGSGIATDHPDITIIKTFIKQHQLFLETRATFQESIKLSILITNTVYNFLLTVVLIQLHAIKVKDVAQVSQTILLYINVAMMSFCFYLSSETLDDGNELLVKALAANHWYDVPPDVARLLIPTLLVAQRPKRFIYFGGLVDVCFGSFLKVIRFSYSLFTLLNNVLH